MNNDFFKNTLVIGGAIGFLLTFSAGYFVDNDFSTILKNSAIGCLVGGALAKIFLSSLRSNMRSTQLAKNVLKSKKNKNEN